MVNGRYPTGAMSPAQGWTVRRLTPPSRLFGANGLRTGPDGRIYVAQVSGSQISAIDVDTGVIEAVSPKGSDIVAPDDLAFDERGNLYATEITEGRVSVRSPTGATRVLQGDMPGANPITIYQGRVYAGECRPGGRILELDLNGGAPRVLLEDVPMPNAMEVGPDGLLYIPIMGTNEIWRVSLEGGVPEKVAGDLGVPDAVKFDASGYMVSTQVASGQVFRIDPRSGSRTVLANLSPGLDNLAFAGERLFVSNIAGSVTEVLGSGETRSLVPEGFNWPLGLAVGADGALFVADGPFSYIVRPDGERQLAGMLFTPGCPGYIRGVAGSGRGDFVVTTANGHVALWSPERQHSEIIAEGLDRLYGVVAGSDNTAIVAEAGAGRVLAVQHGSVEALATGLDEPMGVAVSSDGTVYVSECGAGRVVRVCAGRVETVVDGLVQPQGLIECDGKLFVVDAVTKELLEFDMSNAARRTLVSGLPVGAPAGITPKFLRGIPPLSGPMGPFAGLAVGADGTFYVSGDAEGSVIAVRARTAG